MGHANNKKYDIAIINFYPIHNFGSVIQNYALQQTLSQLGYSSKVVNHYTDYPETYDPISFVKEFSNKLEVVTPNTLRELNDDTETFLFGGDCIWSHVFTGRNDFSYFGDFVDICKRKFSYAPSFGVENYKNSPRNIVDIKQCLSTFHRISVREPSGVKILKEIFDTDATWVLEPVFLLEKGYYEKIINDGNEIETNRNKVFHYSFEFSNIAKTKLTTLFGDDLYMATQTSLVDSSMAKWLACIKNSKLVISSSFHCICFALIFNTPFYVIINKKLDASRFRGILEMIGLEDRILVDENELIEKYDAYKPINWNNVSEKLSSFRKFSINWLKEAIESDIEISPSHFDIAISNLQGKIIDLRNQVLELRTQNRILLNFCKGLRAKIKKRF